jgi:hypothetical protein
MKKAPAKTSQLPSLTLNRETLAILARATSGAEDHTHVGFCSNKVACTN